VCAPVVLLTAAVRRHDVTVRLASGRHVASSAPASARHDHLHASTTSRPGLLLLMLLLMVLLVLLLHDRRCRFIYREMRHGNQCDSLFVYLFINTSKDILVTLSHVKVVQSVKLAWVDTGQGAAGG